jgi:hypothetical protein
MRGSKALEIIPGASHLFPEPGALEAVIDHAARWFERHLAPNPLAPAAGSGDKQEIMMPFKNRIGSGAEIGTGTCQLQGSAAGDPRAHARGVPVAAEVASALNAPLDLILCARSAYP